MEKKTPAGPVTSIPMWEGLESFVPAKVQATIQAVLEEGGGVVTVGSSSVGAAGRGGRDTWSFHRSQAR